MGEVGGPRTARSEPPLSGPPPPPRRPAAPGTPSGHRAVALRTRDAVLPADVVAPAGAVGVVVCAHAGSGRGSPQARAVARALEAGGLAAVVVDLVTEREAADAPRGPRPRDDVALLARRVADAVAALDDVAELRGLRVGLCAGGAGAAAALLAAAALPDDVHAVVCRGGRPDLVAPTTLARVVAPVLFLVGAADEEAIAVHRDAARHLVAEHRLQAVPGATRRFEDPAALEAAAAAACAWFHRHLPSPAGG